MALAARRIAAAARTMSRSFSADAAAAGGFNLRLTDEQKAMQVGGWAAQAAESKPANCAPKCAHALPARVEQANYHAIVPRSRRRWLATLPRRR